MINTNMNYHTNEHHTPFLLKGVVKDYIWGGTRLKEDFAKESDGTIAESWECSTHPDGQSIVASGKHIGKTLEEVLSIHPEFIGTHPKMSDGLPILVKFIDAKSKLSIQVHPDDEYAFKNENGQKGKCEMWYVVEAAPHAELIYGFIHNMSREKVLNSLKEGSFEHFLQKTPVKKGDVFYVPAGQVHAICSGCLVAEVQQSSNLTYRLYDYNRIDSNGKMRELHVEKALDVANLKSSIAPRQPMKTIRFRNGIMIETLCHNQYFQVEKLTLNTQNTRKLAHFKTRLNSFCVLLCVEGCGCLRWHDTENMDFFKGDCIFVPADSVDYFAFGSGVFLRISC